MSSKSVGETFNALTEAQQKLVLSGDLLTEQQKRIIVGNTNLSMSEAGVITNTEGIVLSENKATTSTFSLSSAFKGLAASLGITTTALGIITGALATVAVGAIAYKKWAEYQEELRQSAYDTAIALDEQNKSVDGYVERYKELRTALQNAKGDEEATYAIKQDLLTLQNELNDAFGEEYGKLNLVTDAYKDQTEAIKEYNKELAQSYLNENDKAIRTATNKMEGENHYNLSLTGEILNSDRGKILKEIADSYSDRGVTLLDELGDGSYSQFSIHLDADAEDAYATISDFMNDVRQKAIELDNEDLFADILEISSNSLNQSKSIIDEYGEIYRKALLSEIAVDSDLSTGYNQITKAVEDYNEAILKSEDPYNDDNVKNAWNNLQTVKKGIEENTDEWGKYESVTSEAFKQANDSAYSFYQSMQNDDSISKLTNDLKGLSDTDLKSMADDDVQDSFDKLCQSANDYGLEVQDVIDLLVKLGIVQGQIVDDLSNSDEIANPWDFSETISQLDTAKSKLSVLDETFSKLFDADKNTNIGFEDYSAIFEAFKDVEGLDINNFVQQLKDAGQDVEKVTATMEDLISSYLEHSQILDNVTAENKDFIITMLEEMGVANAEQIVMGQLSTEKAILDQVTQALTNNTIGEIETLLDEIEASEETKIAMSQLALEKINVNKNTIDTSADIANIIALAETAGASTVALGKLAEAKRILGAVESAGSRERVGISEKDYSNALKVAQQIENGTFDYGYDKVDISAIYNKVANTKPIWSPQNSVGTKTADAMQKASDAMNKASESMKDAIEVVDFFEERVEELDNAIDLLDANLENVVGSFAKNTLIDAEIGINAEKINNYTDALAMYTQKANEALSKLPSDIADKVQNGAVALDTFIGSGNEQIVENIKEYDKWSDSIHECKLRLAELQQELEDLELAKFTNVIEDFNNQFDIRENSKDLLDKQIDLFKEAGLLVGTSLYDAQLSQSKKQLELLEQEKAKLVEQMNSALASGRVNLCPVV